MLAGQSCECGLPLFTLLVSSDEIREPFCSKSVEDWSKYRREVSNNREQRAENRLNGSKGTPMQQKTFTHAVREGVQGRPQIALTG
jgi:hypothetical protein